MDPNSIMQKQISTESMNRGRRIHRTVELDDDIQSIEEDNSLISTASAHSSHRRRDRRKHSGSKGHHHSSHSRSSVSSTPSISIDELKQSLRISKNGSSSNMKTPSHSYSDRLTIGSSGALGSSRYSVPRTYQNLTASSRSSLPDLVELEQALHEIGEEELKEGIKRLIMQGKQYDDDDDDDEEAKETRRDSLHKTPVAWKTPFEVDRPRLAPTIPGSPSLTGSETSEPDQMLSKEQDAWAGIDALLETRSMDDSFAFSTSEILPKATVKAMRRDLGTFDGEGPDGLESVGDSRHDVDSVSRNSSDQSQSRKGRAARKSKKSQRESEADENISELMSVIRRSKHKEQDPRETGAGTRNSSGNLFDMFHWSEKDNVDSLRQKNTKLNRKKKVQLLTNSSHRSNHLSGHRSGHRSGHKHSNHGSDTCSLPSLASFQADDLTAGTSIADWESVTSSVGEEFGGEDEDYGYRDEEDSGSKSSSLAGDGLVLDKGVDEYIRQIQKQLPTIVEDNPGHNPEFSPSPKSVVVAEEESAFDELPTLASLSNSAHQRSCFDEESTGRHSFKKKEEKRAPKPSIHTQLMSSISSIKKINFKGKAKSIAAGDEEKYFPDAGKDKKSKNAFKENRCLLSAGDEGDNWD